MFWRKHFLLDSMCAEQEHEQVNMAMDIQHILIGNIIICMHYVSANGV